MAAKEFDPAAIYAPRKHDLPVSHGEFYGWRVWEVWRHGKLVRLASVTAHTIWQPRKMLEAQCPKGLPGVAPHEAHEFGGHHCGLFTAVTKEQLQSLGYGQHEEGEVKVYGRVALAGKTIAGSQGWRSQYAWPIELWVPTHAPELVALFAQQYSIPVHTGNLNYTRHAGDRS